MNAIRASFDFLTLLPVAPRSGAGLGSARAFFPLVGLALGGLLAGFDSLVLGTLGNELTAGLIVVGLLAATRMLHIDGLMDSFDALLGGYTRERCLEILKDPRVCAFGAIAGVSVLFLKWAALITLAGLMGVLLMELVTVVAGLLGAWMAKLIGGQTGETSWIVVTNEVGMGVVPPSESGREFRDVLGRVNATFARRADRVISMTAGIALDLKALGALPRNELGNELGT